MKRLLGCTAAGLTACALGAIAAIESARRSMACTASVRMDSTGFCGVLRAAETGTEVFVLAVVGAAVVSGLLWPSGPRRTR